MNEESYVDVVLDQRVHMEWDIMLGRIVLQSVEEGKAALLPGVPLGSVLCSVDGELVQMDNYDRLMRKMQSWTNVPDGLSSPPPPPSTASAAEGGADASPARETAAEDTDDQQPPAPASLHLTFRLSNNISTDYTDVFPLPLNAVRGGRAMTADMEEARAHQHQVAAFKDALREGQTEESVPADRILEHFLLVGDWDLDKAVGDYRGVREEARELLVAYEAEGESTTEVPVAAASPQLVWDPASEEPPGLEEFPLFEPAAAAAAAAAAASSEEGEGGGSQARAVSPSSLIPEAEFDVVITEQEAKLGITVENVLERTVICTVSPTSCAFRAGLEEGCLVVALGETSTRSMCHKEVVDRLQQMHRPLRLRLRRLAPEKLQQRRAEMIALMHPHGMSTSTSTGTGGDPGLEARSQIVAWAEQKLLSLVRLLAVGSLRVLPQASELETGRESPAKPNPPFQSEGDHGTTTGLPRGLSASLAADRPELWRERLMDVATMIHSNLRRGGSASAGINERLRHLAEQLQALVDLLREFWWTHPALVPIRWHFIDLVVQLLCVDADASLSVSRDSRELADGPAITLLQELVGRLRASHIENNVNMLLYRLAGSYALHARVACCAVAPSVYARMPPAQQLQVRGLLMRCLTEDLALLRSVVVETLADLSEMMDCHSVKWLFLMLEASAKDGSHRVRTKVLHICYSLAQILHQASLTYVDRPSVLQELHLNRCKLLPFVNCAAEDPDYQVRAAFAYYSPGFVGWFGEHWSSVFIDNLEALMRDDEVDVRKVAVDSIPEIAQDWLRASVPWGKDNAQAVSVTKQRVFDHLLPGFIRLVADPSVVVRTSVAGATGRLLHLLMGSQGEKGCQPEQQLDDVLQAKIVQVMTPLMQRILHDEAPAQVALALLQGMRMDEGILYHGVGESEAAGGLDGADSAATTTGNIPLTLIESQVELLLPAVTFLASHSSWRLRQAVVEALPPFQLLVLPGHKYDTSLRELWVVLMQDGVEIVRRAAAAHLVLIGKVLSRYPQHGGGQGRRWLEERVLPCVRECCASASFKQRQLGLHMVEILLRERCLAQSADPTALIERVLWPLILGGLNDKLPNVRRVASAILVHSCGELPAHLRASETAPLVVTLTHLCQQDADRDVRFFARQCLAVLGVAVPDTSVQ